MAKPKNDEEIIQNEADFLEKKSSIVAQDAVFQSEKFNELESYVKEALHRQDSEKTLTLITKGALSF